MNIYQLQVTNCCNSDTIDYRVTYPERLSGKEPTTHNLCDACWNSVHPFEFDKTTTKKVKIFQIGVSEVVCCRCNRVVTDTMGCPDCHKKDGDGGSMASDKKDDGSGTEEEQERREKKKEEDVPAQ